MNNSAFLNDLIFESDHMVTIGSIVMAESRITNNNEFIEYYYEICKTIILLLCIKYF
jgi:hypothetical protein